MLFLATFVVDSVPLYGEALKHSLDILDLIVMHAAMNRIGKFYLTLSLYYCAFYVSGLHNYFCDLF